MDIALVNGEPKWRVMVALPFNCLDRDDARGHQKRIESAVSEAARECMPQKRWKSRIPAHDAGGVKPLRPTQMPVI